MNNKTLAQVLGAIGAAILFTAPILMVFGAANELFVVGQAVVGLVFLILWAFLDRAQVTRVLSGRGSFFLATAGGVGLALLVGLGVVNYAVAAKFPKTWDVSSNKINSLSEDTDKTLKDLKTTIHAYAFLVPTDREYPGAKDLLERYHDKNQGRFGFEFVDPDKRPELVQAFGIHKEGGGASIALENEGEHAEGDEAGNSTHGGKAQEKVSELSEEGLTNAIVKLTHQVQKKIYFTTGHGEADIKDKESETGYATIVDKLANEGINASPLPLAETKDIPADAAAVLVIGPRKKLLPQEVQTLQGYLNKGGRLVVCLDPQIQSGLEGLLKDYGVEADDDEVIDPLSRLQGSAPDVPIVAQYGQSDITKGFNEYSVFPATRSLVALSETGTARPLALATTNPTAFGETDFAMLADGKASPDGMKRGALAVAVLATKAVTGADKRSEQARLVVFGSSQWADNRWSQLGGNEDLFMNTVSYLAEASDRITIRPRTRDASHLTMTPQQSTLVQFFSVDVLPVTLIAIGIAIWRVRRSK